MNALSADTFIDPLRMNALSAATFAIAKYRTKMLTVTSIERVWVKLKNIGSLTVSAMALST
jgi:hypothetical protein